MEMYKQIAECQVPVSVLNQGIKGWAWSLQGHSGSKKDTFKSQFLCSNS